MRSATNTATSSTEAVGRAARQPAIQVKLTSSFVMGSMGELIEVTGATSPSLLWPALLGVLGLGFFALLQADAGNNDDDDSSPGGGLMQPVA